MPNYKADANLLAQLSEEDKQALLSIYCHRCMDVSLLSLSIYHDIDSAQNAVDKMVSLWFLETVDYNARFPALFLTTLGVSAIKTLFDAELHRRYDRGGRDFRFRLAAELKMNPKVISHQMHLNAFETNLFLYAGNETAYCYWDEKMMPPASEFMMPDGMVELDNYYLFLEMDMGTEDQKRLAQKWDSYRMFLNSPGSFYKGKPIVMLFILEGMSKPNVRKKNVTEILLRHLAERIDGKFEVFIDIPTVLHQIIQSYLLSSGIAAAAEIPSL